MSMTLSDVHAAYGAAWLEPDAAKRLEILAICWSEDGRYMDPTATVTGRKALSDHIGGFHTQMPGARIVLTSGVSHHNDCIYFAWQIVTATGDVAVKGVDFGKLDDDGRISEIIGFFGSPPEN